MIIKLPKTIEIDGKIVSLEGKESFKPSKYLETHDCLRCVEKECSVCPKLKSE